MLATRIVRKTKAVVVAMATGAMPLVTTGSCDPITGVLSFYRNDDGHHGGGFFDVFVEDYYYDDYYYEDYYYEGYCCDYYYDDYVYDDYYYEDYYYEEVIFYP